MSIDILFSSTRLSLHFRYMYQSFQLYFDRYIMTIQPLNFSLSVLKHYTLIKLYIKSGRVIITRNDHSKQLINTLHQFFTYKPVIITSL